MLHVPVHDLNCRRDRKSKVWEILRGEDLHNTRISTRHGGMSNCNASSNEESDCKYWQVTDLRRRRPEGFCHGRLSDRKKVVRLSSFGKEIGELKNLDGGCSPVDGLTHVLGS